jgi:UDP-2-acetamido-3-amino-2,3-dideoxy-glucuronate N-acetyltransferase
MKNKKGLALIGIGRWGKNLLREFNKKADVRYVYHRGDRENLKWLKENYPSIKVASHFDQILSNPLVNAVVIATPIGTHYELAKKALLADKHVFVEKPITNNIKQAQELVKLAAKKKRILFVGHIFSYNPVLAKIKRINAVEPLKNAAFFWNKLGTFNEEIIYNVASHDVATALDLFGQPTDIKTLENTGMVTTSDIIYARLNFPPEADQPLAGKNRRSCTIYINRVSNLKNKTVTLATAKNVYLWENDQLLKLDKKANVFKLVYQSSKTPLEVECAEFSKCLEQNKKPHTSGEFGLEVVKILSRV